MAEHYDFISYQNYALILGEQSREKFLKDVARADLFLFQPTSEVYGILGTDELCASVVPKSARRLSAAYCFNTGFFPIVRHGRWWTGKEVMDCAASGGDVVGKFDRDEFRSYDCYTRMRECVLEQQRREQFTDIRMAEFILGNYQTQHLFLLCNHPASALFVALARRVLCHVEPRWDMEIPIIGPNEANLPGYHAVHPAVIRELGLTYEPDLRGEDAVYYRTLMQELQTTKGIL